MAGEYNINLSNGTVLSALYPLETNGPDNRSVARQVQNVRPQYPITLVVGSPGAGTISIVGDFTNVFRVGQVFEIAGSTGNDGTYTVASVTFGGGNTQVTTVENIVDNNADGSLIAHVFILNGDLVYRFIPTFSFDVQESDGPLITGVDTALETFTVTGDYSFYFLNGVTFDVIGSTGNDGTWTVNSSAFGSGETVITVIEDITDATIDGKIDGIINGTYAVTALGPVVDGLTTIIPVAHGSIRDNVINSIGLPYGQIQYTIDDTNTSLKLPGKGVMNYGEMIIEDMVRMTEHFANDLAPELNTNIGSAPAGSPMKGQLWYKTLANEEGFLFHDGTSWTNQWDFDNGTIILRDPQNTTTPNSDIYITGDETQLPVGYLGTDESGMVIWNEVDPIAQDAILRVLSFDGTENLRVEHDGYIRTANNLEVIGGGNGTTESYFHGKVGIGDNGLPTVERTLTVEGNGITVNSDTGINAGLVLDCPSVTEQSIVEFEVANELISSVHTETNINTVWESGVQLVNDTNVSTLTLRGGAAPVGGTAGGIDITGGTCASGYGYGGPISLTGGGLTDGSYGTNAGGINLTGGDAAGTHYGTKAGYVSIRGGAHSGSNYWQYGGYIEMLAGSVTGTNPGDVAHRKAGYVYIRAGSATSASGANHYGGDVDIIAGSSTVAAANQWGGTINISAGNSTNDTADGHGGHINIGAGRCTSVGSTPGATSITSGGGPDVTGATILKSASSTGTNIGSGSGIVTVQSGNIVHGAGGIQPGVTGKVIITSGESDKSSTGDTEVTTGRSDLYGNSGNIIISTGSTDSGPYIPGNISIQPGSPPVAGSLDGAQVSITGGLGGGGTSGAAKGGDVLITGGSGLSGSGGGDVIITRGPGTLTNDGNIQLIGETAVTGNVGINVISPTGTVDLDVLGDIKTGTIFLGGNGSITAPTYSFTNDPNSGIFSAAANQLGFVTNGVNVFNVEADGTLSVNTAAYETLVLADNDIPNKKFVDDRVAEFDTLAELTDVTITTPADDDVLTYSGAVWVNKSPLPQYEEYAATGGEVIVNTTIPTVAHTASPGLATLQVFLNGIFQMEGALKNYTVTGANQITFNVALVALDDVVIYSFNR